MDRYLFGELDTSRFGLGKQARSLFLPRVLRGAGHVQLRDKAWDKAYEIIRRWADLEASGKLAEKNETALQGEFLTEVFGEALGYSLFSANKDEWNLEAQFNTGGGLADGAIGIFRPGQKNAPAALIELKGPKVNVDKDRFNGRTAVQQCWDYLYSIPECPWGVVSNYVSFRLYHRNQTPRVYELFTLQELRKRDRFEQFYYIFQRGGLLPDTLGQKPRALRLLEDTNKRQREVGDDLYRDYQNNRLQMIRHLMEEPHNKELEPAIRIAQKLLDRIIFIAFCEDRGLLPDGTIQAAFEDVPPFQRVTNPRWQNFLNLFESIDRGNPASRIAAYNGGLFRRDLEVDTLQLEDDWTYFFKSVGDYDFKEEVNVDVLGHLFERSVNDLEEMRRGVLFGEEGEETEKGRMTKSARRKRSGIYYTPPEFTGAIVESTLTPIVDERVSGIGREMGIDAEKAEDCRDGKKLVEYWRACIDAIRGIKVVDPACGSGAFLIRAYECLENRYTELAYNISAYDEGAAERLLGEIPNYILHDNLYGVDISEEAVEISQLALWIRSAKEGKSLEDLSQNIVCGNSLVSDKEVDAKALDWQETFQGVFRRPEIGFDCVIGNPPWERIKLQEREFFDGSAPEIAAATSAAKRRELIEKLETEDPDLYQLYLEAKKEAEQTLDYIRKSKRYPLTGKGDINTYAVFAELASRIVSKTGRVGLLVPSGIATDQTTSAFFANLLTRGRLRALYDFENKAPVFPDVHRSFKFCVLAFGGEEVITRGVDFVFFARSVEELMRVARHITLGRDDIKLINPNTGTCPIFRTKRDAEITKAIYRRVPVLWDRTRKEGGNPWGVKFCTMFHQTNDAELFNTAEELKKQGLKRDGANWIKGKKVYLPLYEAKMVQMYDHRAASVVVEDGNWMRQGQTEASSSAQLQNPEYVADPRWWVNGEKVGEFFKGFERVAYLAYKDVTSATNVRTMIASFIPYVGVLNSLPLVLTGRAIEYNLQCCLLANLNSYVLDFIARQKVGGVHLNFFIVEQFPLFAPDFYRQKCAWDKKQTLEEWISERVLKLTCTSNDMIPLAKATGFKPVVNKWKVEERMDLQAELDAAYFLLYEIERGDAEYILGTFSGANDAEKSIFGTGSRFDRMLKCYDELVEKSQDK